MPYAVIAQVVQEFYGNQLQVFMDGLFLRIVPSKMGVFVTGLTEKANNLAFGEWPGGGDGPEKGYNKTEG